jgi:hypothetical protein
MRTPLDTRLCLCGSSRSGRGCPSADWSLDDVDRIVQNRGKVRGVGDAERCDVAPRCSRCEVRQSRRSSGSPSHPFAFGSGRPLRRACCNWTLTTCSMVGSKRDQSLRHEWSPRRQGTLPAARQQTDLLCVMADCFVIGGSGHMISYSWHGCRGRAGWPRRSDEGDVPSLRASAA